MQADSNVPEFVSRPGLTSDTRTASGEAQLAPGRVAPAAVNGPIEECYSVRLTIPKSTHDKLRRAQSLLSHAIPSGDVVQVLDRALDTLIARFETRKLGSASPRTRASEAHSSTSSGQGPRARHVPARVRRAVWERDRGQCTFVTHAGHRCSARRFLEFDHVQPVARGGTATVEGLRLRCGTHNQYSAERTFGSEFMKQKRERARNAKDQPDRVREPSGLWLITEHHAGPDQTDSLRPTSRPDRATRLGGLLAGSADSPRGEFRAKQVAVMPRVGVFAVRRGRTTARRRSRP